VSVWFYEKKNWFILAIAITLLSSIIMNKTVTTSIGIDYKVSKLDLPLYLKLINFYDRHLNLKWLENRITKKEITNKDKVLKLFKWTYHTINRQPKGLPVMDGHVWNVYIRRYGVSDNFHDLFSTLCNYAGIESFFETIYIKNNTEKMNFSYVRTDSSWAIFDPFNGAYIQTLSGDNWATTEDIKANNWKVKSITGSNISKEAYLPYLNKLQNQNSIKHTRGRIQSPINRFIYQIKKWISGEQTLLE